MKKGQILKSMFTVLLACFVSFNGRAQKSDVKSDEMNQKAVLSNNIKTLLIKTLNIPYEEMNTDWFGTIQAEAILWWAKKGYPQGTEYVKKWLNYHIEHDNKMTDEECLKSYEGYKGRIDRHGVLPFSIYTGNLGVAFPCYVLYQQNKNANAKNVCLSVADAILHYSGRDRFGLIAIADNEFCTFAVPDNGYFSVRGMADASALVDKRTAGVFLKNAVYQAKTSINLFFDKDKKLTRTIYLDQKYPGKTYWCRASGWMIYTLTGLLRHLPRNHPDYNYFTDVYRQIADGLVAYQGPNGGLRVWVNESDSPEEVTGTSMTAGCIQEAMDKGWIPKNYKNYVQKAWKFINSCVTEDGKVINAYTGWAVPAEKKLLIMDERYMGYVPGMVLLAAAQIIKE